MFDDPGFEVSTRAETHLPAVFSGLAGAPVRNSGVSLLLERDSDAPGAMRTERAFVAFIWRADPEGRRSEDRGPAILIDVDVDRASDPREGSHHSSAFISRKTLSPHIGDESLDAVECASAQAISDPFIEAAGGSLLSAIEQPGSAAKKSVERMLVALHDYVVKVYANPPAIEPQLRGGLAPWQERRITELVGNRLDGIVRVADMAKVCDLSISHFARAFKQTKGKPPHRWLMDRRIEAAKPLLVESDLPLSEIALVCGFSDQSHFTRTFSRMSGMGPGAWRRAKRI